jgi:hypothetical protein
LTIKFTQATNALARETCLKQSLFDFEKFSGDFVGRVTPVPIPNTEVKPAGADGTARETAWESRKSPGLIKKARSRVSLERALIFCKSLARSLFEVPSRYFHYGRIGYHEIQQNPYKIVKQKQGENPNE